MTLTKNERMALQRHARASNGRADSARHARLILLLADGLTWATIRAKLDGTDRYISRWSPRVAADRLAGLFARYARRARYNVTDRIEARVLAWTTKHTPSDRVDARVPAQTGGAVGGPLAYDGHAYLGHARPQAASTGRVSGLQRSSLRRHGGRCDRPVVSVPAEHAAVFCVDEKTAIQALDRTDPVVPLSPGRADRPGFEYVRHGTRSLYAAFNTKTGEGVGHDGIATHLGRVRRLPDRHRDRPTYRQRDPGDRR